MQTLISPQLRQKQAERLCQILLSESSPPDLIPGTAGSFGEIVKEINATLVDRLSTTVKEVSKTLDGIASNLNTTLTARLAEELRHLRENLSDKERQVARLQTLIQTLVNTTGERNLQTNNNGRQ